MLNWLWFLCREVRSLTLVYLRVVTGCVDGKIRIFNFLTGDCLREITAETETGQILSLHFHDDRWVMHSHESLYFYQCVWISLSYFNFYSILVNTTSSVKRFQFAKVFWDYTADGGCADVSDEPAAPLRKLPLASVRADHKKPERAALPYRSHFLPTPTKSPAQGKEAKE